MTEQELQTILSRISGLSALVVGDICLDRWASYDPALQDPSRETGLPRVAVMSYEVTPGGGGTVAGNLVALGLSRVAVLGVAGADGHAWELRQALEQRGIESALLTSVPSLQTFTYTKLINRRTGIEDLPRVDFLSDSVPAAHEAVLVNLLRRHGPEFDIILVADQAETCQAGVVGAAVRDELAELAARFPQKAIWVDSRMRLEHFRNVIAKCNREEADAACQRALGRLDYSALRKHLQAPALVVTQGPEGVRLVHEHGEDCVPALAEANPVDICGAGDSFCAGAAAAMKVTGSYTTAAEFGNLVASITIMKRGTGTASPAEILARFQRLPQ
jgi:rfaE bifunctional protein kinase chain/domain